jgi:hypothetical protein
VGRPWREVDLFSFMPYWPEGLDEGTKYVVYYRRSCDHCELMFQDDLAPHPELARNVVAIQVPEDVSTMTGPGAWPMPDTTCQMMELPVGSKWIITTPLALRIENGIVRCAEEGDHHECFGLPPDHDHDH